jgi:hypothetical protein
LLTLNTFNHYDPRLKPADAGPATFTVERARLRVAGQRQDDTGLALARGPFAMIIEKLANGSRGSQYRFERWFANLIGGFEEFDVVLAVVKPEPSSRPAHATVSDTSTLRATSDVAHEAAAVEPQIDDVSPNIDLPESLPARPLGGGGLSQP